MHVATDIGGTFTDFVVLDDKGELKSFKLPSTPKSPSSAVKEGLTKLKPSILSHGTTVATNAVLERKGARCALITTKGFKDILTIARQKRPSLYDFSYLRPKPFIAPELCFEMDERVSAKGEILKALKMNEVNNLKSILRENKVEAAAVSLLFSFLRPEHERKIKKELQDLPVSLSSEVLPEFREYERTSTTVLDAYVKTIVGRYISDIEQIFENKFYIMQSSGGVTTSNVARKRPINILLSGPAGGVAATKYLGELLGLKNLISFDMGGTSADISLVIDSEPVWTSEGEIAGVPVRVPMLDIITIGAGGGSIAWRDAGGALRVGPESAGAEPGPICYGKGGKRITVTDCNLLAGYLGEKGLLGGKMPLKRLSAEKKAIDFSKKLKMNMQEFISGVQKVVCSNMIRAMRLTLAKRGQDPRDFTLVAFGGAGPMHACALAKEIGIKNVIIPFLPGAFSAYGILVSDIRMSFSKSVLAPLADSEGEIKKGFNELQKLAQKDLKNQEIEEGKATFLFSLDLRYKGQSYEINVDFSNKVESAFHKKHKKLYGYAMPSEQIELVNVRLFVVHQREKQVPKAAKRGKKPPKSQRKALFDDNFRLTKVYLRSELASGFQDRGPAIVEEETATTVIPPVVFFRLDDYGLIHMEVD